MSRALAALREGAGPFALLYRPETTGTDKVELLTGECFAATLLADLPAGPTLFLVPYRQLAERGFEHIDDHEPIRGLRVHMHTVLARSALDTVEQVPVRLTERGFDIDDQHYADIVDKVLREEIGTGAGANFVIKREFRAEIAGFGVAEALTVFRRLLAAERGAYWVFCVHLGDRTLLGASPERHVSRTAGTAVMNPISGTYRYPDGGPELSGVLDFLRDRKEIDELYMVVDEELKMMARICESGGRVHGPYLKEMGHLAHTEYLIEGDSTRDDATVLRESLFAPTVTGSPLENACRVIARYETAGRGYYSGVLALRTAAGLDSAILIRTADVDAAGTVRIGVGATLVRLSDPAAEVAETHAKARGVLAALRGQASATPRPGAGTVGTVGTDPRVELALGERNTGLARFWLDGSYIPPGAGRIPAGQEVVVVDAEDAFTAMLVHQLAALGLRAHTVPWYRADDLGDARLVLLGPGPGDPTAMEDPKIRRLRALATRLLRAGTPTVAVCLGHQVLCAELGMRLVRRAVPNQGTRRLVTVFDAPRLVGFYNTFAALGPAPAGVRAWCDPETGEVHGLRGPQFASTQFHPESLLTEHGPELLADLVADLCPVGVPS